VNEEDPVHCGLLHQKQKPNRYHKNNIKLLKIEPENWAKAMCNYDSLPLALSYALQPSRYAVKTQFQCVCVLCELEGLLKRQFVRMSLLLGNEDPAVTVEA
jgi:hypothetical protein